ncbi:hypothetical protein XENTR_v10003147 [Xenopus tropicalis]|nr:hypothetical protein XENTR_v10003147 [Xenopus tropicalis]
MYKISGRQSLHPRNLSLRSLSIYWKPMKSSSCQGSGTRNYPWNVLISKEMLPPSSLWHKTSGCTPRSPSSFALLPLPRTS